jgi:PAS domain S-box-containing protein
MDDHEEIALGRAEGASAARLAGIVESAMDAIITVDADQRIVLFNRAAEQMFRCPAAEAMGQTLDRFIPESFRAGHRRHVRSFGETGGTRAVAGLRSDGEEFPVEASISQVEAGGQKLYTVIMRDITERRRMESQILRAQRMESIGTLAGGIAHDLNNVFSPVMMALEVLQAKHTDEESQVWLRILSESVERGASMVKQVLSFARGADGKRVALQPKHLLSDLIRVLKETLPKSIEIRFNIPRPL